MYKIVLILMLHTFLYCNTLHFKEQRYIYAIDMSTYKKGVIEFKENSIITSYKNSEDILIYTNDTLTVKNNETTKEVDLNTNVQIKIFFLLIKAIYQNNQTILKQFFNIEEKNKIFTLIPNETISNYISHIQYKKTSILEFLNIELTNQDRIIIEEIY